jgi:WD40 repeat protein
MRLEVFETSTFKKIWDLECPGTVRAITLAGDSKDVLVAACGYVVRSWNLRSGHMMCEITELEGMSVDKLAAWSEYVACASSEDKFVRIYEVFTGVFATHINAYEKNTTDCVGDLFFSSLGDGLVLTTSDTSHDIRVFRLGNGEWLRNIGGDIVNPRLTSDGHYILSTNSRNDISVWNLETGLKLTNVFRHPPTSIITDIIANDLTVLVTLSDNGILRVWDLEKEEAIQQSFSHDKHDNCIRNVMFVKSTVVDRLTRSANQIELALRC